MASRRVYQWCLVASLLDEKAQYTIEAVVMMFIAFRASSVIWPMMEVVQGYEALGRGVLMQSGTGIKQIWKARK